MLGPDHAGPGEGSYWSIPDLQMVVTAAAGNWSERYVAVASGDGIYELALRVPDAGFYRLFFSAPSLGATVEDWPTATIKAT